MKRSIAKHLATVRPLLAILVCSGALTALAQTVYRIVGPDGKVTFSDKAPATPEAGKVAATGVGARTENTGSALPFELRQIASKYPVVLYTAKGCGPCDAGRALLNARGIPFNERTVSTPEDRDYLQRLSTDNSLPLLTIGGQKIRGLSELEWTQYLDAAGYPKTSTLPPGYRQAAPAPLVAVQKAQSGADKADNKPPTVELPMPQAPSSPTGITF